MININNTYWNGEGKYQKFVDYIESIAKWTEPDLGLPVPKTLAQEYDRAAHAYKRFFNDGDIPKGYKYEWKQVTADYLENRVNKVIVKLAAKMNYDLNKGVQQ